MKQLDLLRRFVSGQKNLEKEFVEALLRNDVARSIELGKMLFSRSPMFLVTSLLVSFLDSPTDESKKNLFLKSLENATIKSNLIWMLYKRGLLVEDLHHYVQRIAFKDHMYYLVLKEACIHGHHGLLERGAIPECVEFLLDNLDDWDLYRYALDNGIDLRRRESLNHEYYLLHKLKERGRAIELLKSRLCFKEIEYIAEMVGLESHPQEATDCVVQLMRNGFGEDLLRRAYGVYAKDPSVFNIKMLIAVLVSARRAPLLGVALYLAFKHRRDHQGNYEVLLIFAFLCRYFCFYPHVLECLDSMGVKNAQVPNLSFIWSDILITKGIKDDTRRKGAINNIRGCMDDLDNSIRHFISGGNFAHVVDALELRRSLKESVILMELEKSRIIGSNPNNSFRYLLGTWGSYLFEKMTVEKVPKGKGMFLTDFYVSGSCSLDEVLENGLCTIESEGFKAFFEEMVRYQESINK
ncbi:hypothetical protein [Encephalitozoon cuniculi GB-M1]|uniref:Uncharacterized protein n=1 Tax=Encephalitozoon cuniculi (strain GB-M1) TaxID=284813 RepID=Q8SW33_ENCCU|nr:uncharacterized protein ECU03_0960 [Encephalitozoon cuniculi GB-M1]CAD26240.1 hypothetical protein [Encephalitozoon cuniculi GB-M1]